MLSQFGFVFSFVALAAAGLYLFFLSGEMKSKSEEASHHLREMKSKSEEISHRLREMERELKEALGKVDEEKERFRWLDRRNDHLLSILNRYERRFGPIENIRDD